VGRVSPDGVSTRAVVRIFLTVALLSASLYFLYLIRSVLLLLLTAVFVAVALGPLVDVLTRRRISRAASIVLVYVTILASIVGVGLIFVPPLVSGVQSLAKDTPTYIQKLRRDKTVRKYDNRYHITDKLEQQAATLPSKLSHAAGKLRTFTVGVFSEIAKLLTVLALTFFLLLHGERIAGWCLDQLPPERVPRARLLAGRIYHAVGGYVAGNLAISVVAGTVSFVTLTVLGVPFALPLSVLMGFLDLIPLVGATTGAVIVGIVTLFNGFPTSTIVWAVVQLVYQQVENNVLSPVIYRRTVEVSGLVTLIAVLIGGSLLGILGVIIAIPVAAAVQIVLIDLWRVRDERRASAAVEAPSRPA
jgi:predicted PurR-regulated permease PerM